MTISRRLMFCLFLLLSLDIGITDTNEHLLIVGIDNLAAIASTGINYYTQLASS